MRFIGRKKRAKRLSVHLPCKKKSLRKARSIVKKFANKQGFSAEADDIALAVQEALKNIIQHACPADNTMRFVLIPSDDEMIVEVSDRGQGFDVETLKFETPSPTALHGRGVQIIKGLMDDVTITSGKNGTIVRMQKKKSQENPV